MEDAKLEKNIEQYITNIEYNRNFGSCGLVGWVIVDEIIDIQYLKESQEYKVTAHVSLCQEGKKETFYDCEYLISQVSLQGKENKNA